MNDRTLFKLVAALLAEAEGSPLSRELSVVLSKHQGDVFILDRLAAMGRKEIP